MWNSIKKQFPKMQKKLKWFLTDESGKITKKDALGISLGASILTGTNEAIAALPSCSYPSVWHGSGVVNGHHSSSPNPSSTPSCATGSNNNYSLACTTNVSHTSGIVNGHYSWTPTITVTPSGHCNHASHASHSNHGSWGWC